MQHDNRQETEILKRSYRQPAQQMYDDQNMKPDTCNLVLDRLGLSTARNVDKNLWHPSRATQGFSLCHRFAILKFPVLA